MIKLAANRENGRTPTARVSKVGGIYRHDNGLIKVTLLDGNARIPTARMHLLWQPWEWLDCHEQVGFVMDAFKHGVFAGDVPRTH